MKEEDYEKLKNMYKMTLEDVVAFTNWWTSKKLKRKARESDVQEYFNLPKI